MGIIFAWRGRVWVGALQSRWQRLRYPWLRIKAVRFD